MRIGICKTGRLAESLPPLIEELERRGHQIVFFHAPPVRDTVDLVFYRGHPSARLTELLEANAAFEELVLRGCRVLNPPQTVRLSRDKRLTASCFEQARIPHPPTWIVDDPPPDWQEKFVAKPVFGSLGKGIAIFDDWDVAVAFARSHNEPYLIQGYISGRVVRAVATPDEVVLAYEKRLGAGEMIANVARGATRHMLELSDELAQLAIASVRALGSDLMGMDLVVGDNESWVLEGNTGFRIYPEDTAATVRYAEIMEEIVAA